MSEVVRLSDKSIVSYPGSPDESTIKLLEDVLKRAKDGEIVGAAIAVVFHDEATIDAHAGLLTRGQVGRLFSLMQEITKEMDSA